MKVFTDHVEGLAALGEFLTERHAVEEEPESTPAAHST